MESGRSIIIFFITITITSTTSIIANAAITISMRPILISTVTTRVLDPYIGPASDSQVP